MDLNKANLMNEYPLQIAIRFNKVAVVEEMLKNSNMYLNTFDNGYNPLIDACEKDLTEIGWILRNYF